MDAWGERCVGGDGGERRAGQDFSIPGHGELSNLDDVREFTKMLKETSAVVENALKAHKTLEQMKQEKILDPWKRWSGDFVNTDAFIETLYNSLTGTKGRVRKT